MGRRSRKRPETPGPPRGAPARTRPVRRRPSLDERPKPPWHPVPLVELLVLAGIVTALVGFLAADGRDGQMLLVLGLVLASVGGLDTALREHFSGYRSHSLVLAGIPAVAAAAGAFFARAPWIALVAATVAVFAAAGWALRATFRRRSGGLSWR